MQERAASTVSLASNTVRWVIGPTGTIVTFSEDIGLPSIFDSVPCRYKFALLLLLSSLFSFFTHTHSTMCVHIHILYFSSCTWPMSLFDCLTGFYCVEFQLSSPTWKMCSSKLHKFIQVSGFQVKASPLQSTLLQGNTPKDATSNCLLMSSFFSIYHIGVYRVKVGLGRWNSSFRSDTLWI